MCSVITKSDNLSFYYSSNYLIVCVHEILVITHSKMEVKIVILKFLLLLYVGLDITLTKDELPIRSNNHPFRFTFEEWQLTKNSTYIAQYKNSSFLLRNFVNSNCTKCSHESRSWTMHGRHRSVDISFYYAIYNKHPEKSKTVFKFGTVKNEGEINWHFEAINTNGSWHYKSVCFTYLNFDYSFVFYTDVSEYDEIALTEISFIDSNGCYPQVNILNCAFNEPNLCNWTVAPGGVKWMKTKSSEISFSSSKDDSCLLLQYNSDNNFIANGLIYSPILINQTSYLKIAFNYYIHSSRSSSATELKLGISQFNHFRWIFESNSKLLNEEFDKWIQHSLCVYIDTEESMTRIVFQGTVGGDSKIAIDNVVVTQCLHQLSISCSFEKDICGWQMKTDYFIPWIREKKSASIPPRVNDNYYIKIAVTSNSYNVARLVSPLLVTAECLEMKFWYYTDGNETTTKLTVISQEGKIKNLYHINITENDYEHKWLQTSLYVENVKEDTELIIEAKVAAGYVLAIDEIEIEFGNEMSEFLPKSPDPKSITTSTLPSISSNESNIFSISITQYFVFFFLSVWFC